jgi:hypothetical protein
MLASRQTSTTNNPVVCSVEMRPVAPLSRPMQKKLN